MKQSERPAWRKWYDANKERIIAKSVARQKANPEKSREYRLRYEEKHHDRLKPIRSIKSRDRYRADPVKGATYARERRRMLRLEFLAEYGGKCQCCGEANEVFLTLEHKNRDGKAHRKAQGNSPSSLLADLKRRGWPKDAYEILCFNCNRAMWALGECPHGHRT